LKEFVQCTWVEWNLKDIAGGISHEGEKKHIEEIPMSQFVIANPVILAHTSIGIVGITNNW
jgi:hypothetical protein